MCESVRIMARLDIKGPNLVKGVHLEGLRVLGRPERFARTYYMDGVDELLYIDAVASLYGRNSLEDIVRRTSSEIFVPLTVGGGLRSIHDIRAILRAGADKVAINTAAVHSPQLISKAAAEFGSSTIVVSIAAKQQDDRSYHAYTDNGREATNLKVIQWACRACEFGAGEILLTSIDKEGTGRGFDTELVRSVADTVGVPTIASGGAGRPEDIARVIKLGHADAVAVASLWHYHYAREVLDEGAAFNEGNVAFLRGGKQLDRFQPVSLSKTRSVLAEHGIRSRFVLEKA